MATTVWNLLVDDGHGNTVLQPLATVLLVGQDVVLEDD